MHSCITGGESPNTAGSPSVPPNSRLFLCPPPPPNTRHTSGKKNFATLSWFVPGLPEFNNEKEVTTFFLL